MLLPSWNGILEVDNLSRANINNHGFSRHVLFSVAHIIRQLDDKLSLSPLPLAEDYEKGSKTRPTGYGNLGILRVSEERNGNGNPSSLRGT